MRFRRRTVVPPERRHRHRLRRQLMGFFAAGGLVLALGVTSLTYFVVRRNLLDDRQSSATRQTLVNGRLVATALRSATIDVPRLLGSFTTGSLSRPVSSGSLVLRRGQWIQSNFEIGQSNLPATLRARVANREAARQYFHDRGPKLAVGVPLPDGVSYFEVFSMAELERTLSILLLSLLGASAIALGGSLALGAWFSRKLLGPVAEVGQTARSIAGGRLEARLEAFEYEELADLAESFNSMVDTLQERLERDARFASNVSHELRSPLTTLRTAISGLKSRSGGLDPQGSRLLDILAEEVTRFDELVQDLLEISRIDARSVPTSFETVRLGELVLQSVRRIAPDAIPEIAPEAHRALVQADKRRLERVITNLVRNAEAHGGGLDRLWVVIDDASARIIVQDRGPGVPEDERTKIFERFYRGSGSGRRGSTDGVGLGLALVAEHMRLHQGRVWVEEAPGGGARFIAELPVVDIVAADEMPLEVS
jgi:signal transduction histidine kinase